MDENNESDLLKRYFDAFSDEGDEFTEDWPLEHAEEHIDELDQIYGGETDSGNPACGDEAEFLYERRDGKTVFYFSSTSSGGLRGPFGNLNEAIEALGYDPETFSLEAGSTDSDED